MTLLDTSAWIQLFKDKSLIGTQLRNISVCPPVIQEVLQGVRQSPRYEFVEKGLLSLPCLSKNLEIDRFLEAAEIYRIGRRKGVTIRSPFDCLIGAIAIHHDTPVVHVDRDFSEIEKFTALRTIEFDELFN